MKEFFIPLRYACGMKNNVETQRAASDWDFTALRLRNGVKDANV